MDAEKTEALDWLNNPCEIILWIGDDGRNAVINAGTHYGYCLSVSQRMAMKFKQQKKLSYLERRDDGELWYANKDAA